MKTAEAEAAKAASIEAKLPQLKNLAAQSSAAAEKAAFEARKLSADVERCKKEAEQAFQASAEAAKRAAEVQKAAGEAAERAAQAPIGASPEKSVVSKESTAQTVVVQPVVVQPVVIQQAPLQPLPEPPPPAPPGNPSVNAVMSTRAGSEFVIMDPAFATILTVANTRTSKTKDGYLRVEVTVQNLSQGTVRAMRIFNWYDADGVERVDTSHAAWEPATILAGDAMNFSAIAPRKDCTAWKLRFRAIVP